MSALPVSKRIRAVAILGCLALAGGLATFGQVPPAHRAGAVPQPAPVAKPEGGPRKFIVDADHCRSCHSSPQNYKRAADRLLCRMSEFPYWDEKDKHKIAFQVLKGDRAREMGERLKINVTESTSCTNCHGMTGVGVAEIGQAFVKEDNGVSCVACHGAYQDWVSNHTFPDDPRWRKYSRKEKETQFGMTDLWDPVTRATKCASCHIGNPDEQKVITHAMYAAGHPPLPGLETATFSDAQPRHWEYLREKKTAAKKDLGFNPGKREQTELVAVSGIVALRETMRLFAAQARQDGLVTQPETHWPDFARFDCYACHHDLQVPSWRQARGYNGTPGRPTTPNWPDVLVQIGIMVADPDGTKGRASEFERAVAAYQSTFVKRPFGDRERSAAAAQALADWADAVGQDLRARVEDPKAVAVGGPLALRLLQHLCRMAEARTLDYDSARQIALAFRTIYRETRDIDPESLPDPAIPGILDALDRQFQLSLPSAGTQTKIENTLAARLKAVFDFDPVAFRSQFTALAGHLPAR
jgi:hypothetical protein